MDELTSELWTALLIEQYDLANQLINRGANVNEPRSANDNPAKTLLHYAAAIGDIQWIRLLINHSANLNVRDTKNRTPLHWAVKNGDRPDIVEVLINAGADIEARDDNQETPLHLAVTKRFNESALKLIARGASIDSLNSNGLTLLHRAVLFNNLSMVKLLLSYALNVNAKDNFGRTPLLITLSGLTGFHDHAHQLLYDNGADINTQSQNGNFPLCSAVRDNCLTSVHRLLRWGARVNEASIRTGETALHEACKVSAIPQVVTLLFKFGADLNARNHEGKTPFELLPEYRTFSEATARVVIREAVIREALGQPLCEEYKQMVQSREIYSQFDRKCREDVMRMQSEKIDIEDSAMSFFYIFSMDEEKLARLARNKKIVTAFETSDYPATFRIYAGELITKFEVSKKRANFLLSVEDCLVDVLGDILPALIVHKIASYVKSDDCPDWPSQRADVVGDSSSLNLSGLSVITRKKMDVLTSELWTVLILGQHDLANRLIHHGANVNEPTDTRFDRVTTLLHYAAAIGDTQCMRLLIKHGANLDARDTENRTPLHFAVMTDDRPDLVEVLINAGAVVDARDDLQRTPLHLAVKEKFNKSAQKLIARGASVEAVDCSGRSVLHTAVLADNLSMVKVLISHNVNIEAKDTEQHTPLSVVFDPISGYYNNMDIIQLLLESGANVNTKSAGGEFPLYNVFSRKTLCLLLKWGARVNEVTDTGDTALHHVCVLGEAEAAALLLKFGADLNARNREGKTPFELIGSILAGNYSAPVELTSRVVIREAVKREALGQPLCEGYQQKVQSREIYSQFDRECREEIMRMKSEKIDIEESDMTFFDVLSMDEEKLAELARNKKIVTAFEASDYLALFRIYAGELITKFEVAKKRGNFLMNVEDCLVDALGDMIPASIVYKIASYVKSGDIIQNEL